MIYPLLIEHGPDAVITELASQKGDPLVASALAYAAGQTELRLTEVFSDEEIVKAALDYLVNPADERSAGPRVAHDLQHGAWAWFALLLHHADGPDGELQDEDHFRLVLSLIEVAPWDNRVLWLIGDGPLAHACADERRYEEVRAMRKTDPKLARIFELPE